ncbi:MULTISPECIES: hypothetical protein [unclassified Solwaraspora]|uniref:hypothetical protein n=1 Tax=unclassified Solwaraspora TaxID=2627926 RepID=UPI00259B299E|nr:hypothetical protein [Solwaraspora sp. WMMA2056]WJK39411.1 hypothetical protein O7608_23545 [Solwaraspora sp. WMMA2056]
MTDPVDGVWRDEQRLPLRDLERAVAAPAADGEVDDVTGSDAGAEEEFGHGPEAAEGGTQRHATDPDRAYRPSTTGRTGPN